MSRLGETLRSRREELCLGQRELADRLDVRQQTISRWEKGLALPRPRRLLELARLLDLDARSLQRLAGYLPETEGLRPEDRFPDLYERMLDMTSEDLLLLIEGAWQELRRRRASAAGR